MNPFIAQKDLWSSLNRPENYNLTLDVSRKDATEMYLLIMLEYCRFIVESTKTKSSHVAKFIILRGIDTITHVFQYLLFHTQNMKLTQYHCKQSFYFYVEFVEQTSDDEKSFLQLTSRDATTYVYKKTVFDIIRIHQKKRPALTTDQANTFAVIDNFVNIFKSFLHKIIMEPDSGNIDTVATLCTHMNQLELDKETSCLLIRLLNELECAPNYFEIVCQIAKKCNRNNNILHPRAFQHAIAQLRDAESLSESSQSQSPAKFVTRLFKC